MATNSSGLDEKIRWSDLLCLYWLLFLTNLIHCVTVEHVFRHLGLIVLLYKRVVNTSMPVVSRYSWMICEV